MLDLAWMVGKAIFALELLTTGAWIRGVGACEFMYMLCDLGCYDSGQIGESCGFE